jgi:mono/diheme cytochrome c family protein
MRGAAMKHLVGVALLVSMPAWADEASVTLKPGPGADVTAANCATCHSLDYIQINGGFMPEATWKAEVAKMRGPFGAPIEAALADEILAYLVKHYGAPAR